MSSTDIVIVGSGFGGSVAAARFAERGCRVTVLERGPWRDTLPVRSMGIVRRAPLPLRRHFYTHLWRGVRSPGLPGGGLTLNRRGVYELHIGSGLDVVCTAGVGGNSHVYGAIHCRPARSDYWDGLGRGVSQAELAVHYDRVCAELGSRVTTLRDQVPNTIAERLRNYPEFDAEKSQGDLAMGFLLPQTPGQPRIINLADGIQRQEADMVDGDLLGSATGGKTTADFLYLAPARQRGAQILDLHEALAIFREPASSRHRFRLLVRDHVAKRDRTLFTNYLVLAAGTVNTIGLLMRSRALGGLDGMPALGKNFGGNGDFLGYWQHHEPTRDLTRGLATHGRVCLRQQPTLANGRPWPLIVDGALPAPDRLPFPLAQLLRRKLTQGTIIAGMGEDAMNGVVILRKGHPQVSYRAEDSTIFADLRAAFAAVSKASAAPIRIPPRIATVHPSGGCCVGISPETSVIDGTGEVHDQRGIFVVDGAVLPRPLGVPPALSITAWSSHVAEQLSRRLSG